MSNLKMKELISNIFGVNANENNRNKWLKETIGAIPAELRILDAGAGELRNKPLCAHLNYISQDVCQYEGNGDNQGLQTGAWDTSKIDLICDIMDKFNATDQQRSEVIKIYESIKNRSFNLNRSRPRSVGSGVVYFWITSKNMNITIKEFAKQVDLSESTILKICKEINMILSR